MDHYTFSNRFKRIKNINNIRPDIRRPCGIGISHLLFKTNLKQETIKDRIIDLLKIKRSRHFKFCYDQVDNIDYIYDLNLFRKHQTQDQNKVDRIILIKKRKEFIKIN